MSDWWQEVDGCPASADVLLACEGELPRALRQRIMAHLRECAPCQERLRDHDAVRAAVSSYHLSDFDGDRPNQVCHDFDRSVRYWVQARAMHLREGWGLRVIASVAVVLLVVAGLSAHPQGFVMLARFAAVVRETLNFGPDGSGLPQARAIKTSERIPSLPAPAAAPAEPAESADTPARQTSTTAVGSLPDRDTLDQAELDARLVLSDASLDLLRGIHVSSTPKNVRVEGVIPTPRRRVVARLNALKYVRVSLRPGPVADGGPGHDAPGKTRVTGLARWVDYRLGDRPEKHTFVPELTRLTTAVTERVHTLHGLAERYSDDAVKEMSPAARAKLQKLLDRHYQSLNTDLNDLDARLAVLFGSTTRVFAGRRAPSDWQQRVNSGFTHAESLDRSLRELLTREDLPPVPEDEDMPEGRPLRAAFGALWDAVHASRP